MFNIDENNLRNISLDFVSKNVFSFIKPSTTSEQHLDSIYANNEHAINFEKEIDVLSFDFVIISHKQRIKSYKISKVDSFDICDTRKKMNWLNQH